MQILQKGWLLLRLKRHPDLITGHIKHTVSHMTLRDIPPPPRETANPAPPRPANSVRRTSSIDVSWPDGIEGDRRFIGTARDYLTRNAGDAGTTIAEGRFDARLAADKTIIAITTSTHSDALARLVGERGGGHLRMILREIIPDMIERADPLYLLLDDISGTALVSAFAREQWAQTTSGAATAQPMAGRDIEKRIDVCWGLQRGNTGVQPGVAISSIANADAGDIRNPADPLGWHELPSSDGPAFRRARRIDVIRDESAGLIHIDSAFQDSALQRDGGRIAVHEYLLKVSADIETLEIRSIAPEARILPFPECPGAIHNAQRLVGGRLDAIRDEVLGQLRGTAGCTHLNDALRALADVPRLAGHLRELA